MKILITNDDGIEAIGIKTLARWAQKLGEVTVVAPKRQQSGMSHSINITDAVEIKKLPATGDYLGAHAVYYVDSTPADCVRFGLSPLEETEGRFDMVLSGINRGYNLGADIVYSGTAGAVFESSLFGRRSLAFSAHYRAVGEGADTPPVSDETLDRVWDYISQNGLLERGTLYNINIPPQAGEITLTRQGGPFYRDVFRDIGDGMFKPEGVKVFQNRHDRTVDTDAVTDGFISVTPLMTDRTDAALLSSLWRDLGNDAANGQ